MIMDNLTVLPICYQMDVFDVPELCNRIFGFADKASLARCARVCSALSDCALDNLWRKLDNPRPLFEILSPLGPQLDYDDGLLHFLTKPRRRDWERFQSYAQRVRDLSISADFIHELSKEAIMRIYHKRLTVFTPMLTRLSVSDTWRDVALDFSVLFMSESLIYLSIDFRSNRLEVTEIFEEVVARAPHLKHLELHHGMQIGMEVADLLPQLSMLEVIHLPINTLTSQVVKALLCLPRIKKISWRHESVFNFGQPGFNQYWQLSSDGPFPYLTKLGVMADISNVTKVIGFIPNISSLQLWFRSFESAEALHSFLEAVSHSCRSLISLRIDPFPPTWSNASLADFSRRECLTFPSKPFTFLPFPALTTFTLLWPVPLMFNNDELVQFISAFPIIQILHLNCHPAVLEKPALTLDILPEIANTCPEIRYLALYVDCTIPPSDLSESYITPVFKKLFILDLGVSPTNGDIYFFSKYFSMLCGASCELVSDHQNLSEKVIKSTLKKYGAKYLTGTWRNHCRVMEGLARLFIEARDEAKRSVTQEKDAAFKDKHAALEEKNIALKERDLFMEKWRAAESELAQLRGQRDETGEGTFAGSDSTEQGSQCICEA